MMKRVIDYLKNADKSKLAQKFAESDSLAILLGIKSDTIIDELDAICKTKCDLKNSSHAVLAYKVHFTNGAEYRFDAISINALENDEVVIHGFHELATKTLLESVVPRAMDDPQLVELLLLNVLHAEIMFNHIDRLFELRRMNFAVRYHKNMELARDENRVYGETTLKELNNYCYLNSIVALCDEILTISKASV